MYTQLQQPNGNKEASKSYKVKIISNEMLQEKKETKNKKQQLSINRKWFKFEKAAFFT